MAKRIVICADGTWTNPEQRDHRGLGDGRRSLGASNPDGCEVIHRCAVERRRRDSRYGQGGLQTFISLCPTPAISDP